MMQEFTYEQLKASNLTSGLKASGNIAVKLSKKQANIASKFIENIKKLMGEDGKEWSTMSCFVFLVLHIFSIFKIVCFYSRLFELFVFYFNTQPQYKVEDYEKSFSVMRFYKIKGDVAH